PSPTGPGRCGPSPRTARCRPCCGSPTRPRRRSTRPPGVPRRVTAGARAGGVRAPYLRAALLDAGALAETLETATFWDRLPETYAAVRDALVGALSAAGTPPLVLCHISHVYETGAALYFTVVGGQAGRRVT